MNRPPQNNSGIGWLWLPWFLWVFIIPGLYFTEIISTNMMIAGLVISALIFFGMTLDEKEIK